LNVYIDGEDEIGLMDPVDFLPCLRIPLPKGLLMKVMMEQSKRSEFYADQVFEGVLIGIIKLIKVMLINNI
jgi:hypothetical protein